MKRLVISLLACCSIAVAQTQTVRGTITYVSGDAIYTSLGRDAGVEESALMAVMADGDTIAVLTVFAASSKSSVCRAVRSSRKLQIGDAVRAERKTALPVAPAPTAVNSGQIPVAPKPAVSVSSPGAITLHGKVSTQYNAIYQAGMPSIHMPGIVVNLRGDVVNSPFRFEFYGNIRSLGYRRPLGSGATSQSRIYRMSVDYDDDVYQFSVGRIIPRYSPSTGYVDGFLGARRFGVFSLGAGFGFEPALGRQLFSTDLTKFFVFGSLDAPGRLRASAALSYARTYDRRFLDREVISSFASFFPTDDLYFTAQSDIDLRFKSGDQLVLKPRLTTLFAVANYRFTRIATLGLGLNAWRPTYSFTSVIGLPDSLLDSEVRVNPSLNLGVYLPGGIALYNAYAPRTSAGGFSREYSEYMSASISNVFDQGITIRGFASVTAAQVSTTRGFGASVQGSLLQVADATVRYQTYRYEIPRMGDSYANHALALDLLVGILNSLTFWGSVERSFGENAGGQTLWAELSWRF